MVKEVILQIDSRMQQLELDLFGKENADGGTGSIRTVKEQLEDPAGMCDSGTERAENDPTGHFGGTGE
jgi:hypothetical protein